MKLSYDSKSECISISSESDNKSILKYNKILKDI